MALLATDDDAAMAIADALRRFPRGLSYDALVTLCVDEAQDVDRLLECSAALHRELRAMVYRGEVVDLGALYLLAG